jgi:hypothetical protein
MALTHSVVTLNSSTATLLNNDPVIAVEGGIENRATWQYGTISVQNTDASIVVYLGGSTVTTSSYGVSLAAGSSITLDSLSPNEKLYAIAASGTPKVAILMVTTA